MDTAAREKEIEERLLKDKQAQKERKEVGTQEYCIPENQIALLDVLS